MASWQDLTNEQLLALPTNRLYTVYKLMQKRRGHLYYDINERGKDDPDAQEKIKTFDLVKAELDTRGHIEREKVAPNYGRSTKPNQNYDWFNPKPACEDPVGPIKDPSAYIGKQVFKRSKKPFKSKQFYNTVKSVTTNPHTKRVAFSFEDDSSVVDVHQCNLRENK